MDLGLDFAHPLLDLQAGQLLLSLALSLLQQSPQIGIPFESFETLTGRGNRFRKMVGRDELLNLVEDLAEAPFAFDLFFSAPGEFQQSNKINLIRELR